MTDARLHIQREATALHVSRLLLRAWPLLLALSIIFLTPLLLMLNAKSRVAVESAVYLSDMVVQPPSPFRPLELISDAPTRERIVIEYESRAGPREIEADLYMPRNGDDIPGVVFSMGAPPLDLDEPRLVRIAEDGARKGVAMLVPFSERLDEWRIEPEEIDALVAAFQHVQGLERLNESRVGFFGASVGGSLALVAAGDPRIAADVDHVVSFGGYYDAIDAFGGIATDRILYKDVDERWNPQSHAKRVTARQLIDRLASERDRELLLQAFVDRPTREISRRDLSSVGQAAYDFLSNRDPAATRDLAGKLPASMLEDLAELSPSSVINNIQAELFIIHDRADPYIAYTESRHMRDDLEGRSQPVRHFDEVRLFEHVEPKLTQRPDVITMDATRLMVRMYQLLLRWD
jgi:acetyl esterase/lipase